MDNEKKRVATEVEFNEKPFEPANSDKVMIESGNQSDDCVDVKDERQIKEEPQSVVELVDVPASVWNNCGVVHTIDVNQPNGEYEFDSLNCDDIKIKVKEETDKKEEKQSKTNFDSANDSMGMMYDHKQLAPLNDEHFLLPEKGHESCNKNIRYAIGGLKNVSKKHKCNLCEYASKRRSDLTQHMNKHTAKKPAVLHFM
ncbi:zinc finger protein Aiolos-like [Sitodiplosis mosellana]|uniref:zinc finger protein Aiolos-like n=1 Tax=Sitodiplosis mosellana TaxID=263140 RepID=UPI002444004D|nr:zinc finger protein Aiolos-like [Sitodiplosis mosellana]